MFKSKKSTAPLLPASLISTSDTKGIPRAMPTSFWDTTSQLGQDYIVIGAGIIGLITAIFLKMQEPNVRVLVLERGVLPAGASTRNGGFACFTSFSEFMENLDSIGVENTLKQIKERWEGLKLMRNLLGDEAIGFEQTGNYELITEALLPQLQHLKKANELLYPLFGENVFFRQDENIEKFGFSKKHIHALIFNQFEGLLDSGKMMKALQEKAQSLGVVIRYGSKAMRPRNVPNGIEVPVENHQGKTIWFRAKAAAVCVNGYTSDLLPELKIKPGRGQIIVTTPFEKPLLFNAPCHMGNGFWYFRVLPDNRILIGGGRNLNFKQETTTELDTTQNIIGPLKKILNEVIVPNQNPTIEYAWAGIMGFSQDHLPRVQTIKGQPNLVIGFGCNGMGVGRGFHIGRETAALLMKSKAPTLKPIITTENETATPKARL